MAGEQEIRGTKNLGLVQAIYAGINPPMNTKIIWYDDNVGVKIHKYYDVTISEWVPFGGNSQIIINGHYVYIAYSSNCDGADFNLVFDVDLHTHTSILSSSTQIPNNQLVPELFQDKWIKFCGESSGGNYTYIAFADDCEGNNFSLKPTYEVKCDTCTLVDAYKRVTPNSNGLNYEVSQVNDGANIRVVAESPKTIEIDIYMLSQTLVNGIEYCINLQVPAEFSSKFFVRLDGNETGGFAFIPNGLPQDLKFKKVNNGSKLYIEFFESKTKVEGEFFIKIGTSVCCEENPPKICKKCRKCWAIITSDTPILELTAENFKDKWVCECCGDGKSYSNVDIQNLKELSYSLQKKQSSDFLYLDEYIKNVEKLYTDLQKFVQDDFNAINKNITNFQNSVNGVIETLSKDVSDTVGLLQTQQSEIDDLKKQLSDEQLIPRINDLLSKLGGLNEYEKMKMLLDSSVLELKWKNGDKTEYKKFEQITCGITDNVYNRNGFIGYNEPRIDKSGFLYYSDPNNRQQDSLFEIKFIHNLITNLEKRIWVNIKDHKPFIQITRYKHSHNKGTENSKFTGSKSKHWRTSGFKLDKRNLKFRPNRILLNKSYQVIDFGQEHYFRTPSIDFKPFLESVNARGLANRFSTIYDARRKPNAPEIPKITCKKSWVYLEFSIGINYNGVEIISKPLQRLNMILMIESGNNGKSLEETYRNQITFKYV